jgi:UDP-glucuronate 4-epimerase
MAMFRFVKWISEGVPVVIYGDGGQSRDFTYVDDIARGTIAALRPLGYEVINLGSDSPVVLMEALRLIEELLGRKAEVLCRACHPADMRATRADNRKARQMLGWAPRTALPEGLAALVEWYGSWSPSVSAGTFAHAD